MIRRHPPHKMLSLLIILLAMIGYFSVDLYFREHAKTAPDTRDMNMPLNPGSNTGTPDSQNIAAEGERPENKIILSGAVIIMEKKYTACKHIIKKQIDAPADMAGLTEFQLKLAYKDWMVKKFTPSEIILYQEVQSKCPNHFILKEKDGFVSVYYQTPVNGITLKEVTPIPVSNLRSEDRKRLETGMNIESQEELAQALEDLGS